MKQSLLKKAVVGLGVCCIVPLMAFEIPADYKAIQCEIKPRISIKSDEQRSYATHPRIPGPEVENDMRAPIAQSTSTNWAGYVSLTNITKPALNSVSSVSGTWIVPTVTKSSTKTYCSIWVGIDGYSSASVSNLVLRVNGPTASKTIMLGLKCIHSIHLKSLVFRSILETRLVQLWCIWATAYLL